MEIAFWLSAAQLGAMVKNPQKKTLWEKVASSKDKKERGGRKLEEDGGCTEILILWCCFLGVNLVMNAISEQQEVPGSELVVGVLLG